MDNQKLSEKIIDYFNKEKYRKYDRLLLKSRNNTNQESINRKKGR